MHCDKVVSLLGMAKECPEDLLSNLNLSAKDMFVKVAQHLLLSNPSFVLLSSGIGYARNIDALPSWVPDWSAVSIYRHNRQGLPLLTSVNLVPDLPKLRSALREHSYSSGMPNNSSSAKLQIQVDELYLTTRSIRVSQVAKISPPFLVSLQNDVSHMASLLNRKSKPASFSATDEILNLCRNSELANFFAAEEILKDIPSQYAYAACQTSIEAFWRTIIGDRWVKVDPTQLLGVLISSPDSEEGEHCFTSFKAVLKGLLIFLENNGFFSQDVNDLTANPIKSRKSRL